jgi:hypothetical protein
MGWEVLIVPLLALVVWILGTLMRQDEDPRVRQRQRRPGMEGPFGPGRQPVSDLDRFLTEARRRRELAEKGLPVPPPPAPAPPPRRPPTPAPRPRPTGPTPSRSAAPPPPRRQRDEPMTVVKAPAPRPARQDQPKGPIPVLLPVPQAEVAVEVVSAMRVPVAAPEPTPAAPVSPAVAQVLVLLRSPQSAATAFVLREILGPPLCLRRRVP